MKLSKLLILILILLSVGCSFYKARTNLINEIDSLVNICDPTTVISNRKDDGNSYVLIITCTKEKK